MLRNQFLYGLQYDAATRNVGLMLFTAGQPAF